MNSNMKNSPEGWKVWTKPNVQRLNAKEARNKGGPCPNDRGTGCGGGSGEPGNKSDGGFPS